MSDAAIKSTKSYEAAGYKTSRLRRPATIAAIDGGSADWVNSRAGLALVKQARFLEQNYDLAVAVLDDLVDKVIGTGIHSKPMIKSTSGEPLVALNKQIARYYAAWASAPDITGELSDTECQRIEFRTLLRDGEIFVQKITSPSAPHASPVPFSLEHIETDFLPHDFTGDIGGRPVIQGVEKDGWGKPRGYHFYRQHPGALYPGVGGFAYSADYRRIPARWICHLKHVQRPKQTRGVTVFHSVINRLMDLRDWDASELTAARVNATMIFQIVRELGMEFSPGQFSADREFEVGSGMVWDELRPGERAEMLKAERPNPNAGQFRTDQIRCFAGGTGGSYSSIAKQYDGSYSSRRQERLEHDAHIRALRGVYISQRIRPVWASFIDALLLSGMIELPRDIDPLSIYAADHRGPTLKSIDPEKESRAALNEMQAGTRSREEVILEDGRDPDTVFERIREERARDAEAGLIFSSNTGHDVTPPAVEHVVDDSEP